MNKIYTLSENINKLMKLAHVSESELARSTLINQPVISRIAHGLTTNPNINTLRPIAKFFNISLDQLIGDRPIHYTDKTPDGYNKILNYRWAEVPIIDWNIAVEWKNFFGEKRSFEHLPLYANLSENAYALVVEDSTMEPLFIRGSHIIVEPKIKPLDNNYVIIKCYKQKNPEFRQIFFSGDKTFLKSLNPDFGTTYPAKKYNILGVVVQVQTILRNDLNTSF